MSKRYILNKIRAKDEMTSRKRKLLNLMSQYGENKDIKKHYFNLIKKQASNQNSSSNAVQKSLLNLDKLLRINITNLKSRFMSL